MRRTALMAGVAVATLLLTSCSTSASTGSTDVADKGTTAEISYAYWDETQKDAMDQIIAEFNKEYPGITVKSDITPYSEYFGKLQTQASSDTLPDVFWMNGPNFQLYASNNKFEPLPDGVDPSDYPEALADLYSYDGVRFGAPKDFDTVAVYYNKALFDEAGVEYPTKGWTWDEFHTKAKAISDALGDKGVYGTVNGLTGGQEMYYNTILQAGGEVITDDGKSGYDSPEAIRGLQFVADLIADGSAPTLQQLSDTPQNAWFVNGKSAMFWSGTWSNAELRESAIVDEIGVAPLPSDEREATVIHGLANVVSASSKQKAAAEAFLTFLASERAAEIQAETGAANPAFNGTQDAFIASAPYELQVFLDVAETSSFPYPVSKNTAAWNQLENELLPDAFSGERPVADVAKELAEKMDASLAEEDE